MVDNSKVCREGDGFLIIPNHLLLFIFKFEGWGVRKSKECTSKEEEGE